MFNSLNRYPPRRPARSTKNHIRPRLEVLEDRAVPAVFLYVDNLGDFTITNDQGASGLDSGDKVTWDPGAGSAHGGPVQNLTFGTNAFTSIQAAVNAATDGDMLRVGSGTFAEKVTVSRQLTLLGNQFGIDARTSRGPESVVTGVGNSGQTPFYVTANNVTLDGFTVEGATSGNVFGYGILLGAGTSGSQVLNNIIQDNIIGLGLANNSAVNQTVIQHNLFRNNNATGPAGGNAIYSDQSVAGGALTNVLIDANRFEGHNDAALNLSASVSGSQSAITFSNNDVVDNGRAAFLFNVVDSTFSNNTVSGSTFTGSADFRIYGGVQNVNITGNLLSGGAGDAIRVTGSNNSGLLVQGNSITGYAGDGLEIGSGAYTGSLDATGNWWGSDSGPAVASNPGGTGESIVDPSGQVDYSPWLTTGTDAQPLTPGFQPASVPPPAPAPAPVRGVSAQLVKVGKVKRLFVIVRFADTGEIKTVFRSPFQKAGFKKIQLSVVDTNNDGAADAVKLTARRLGSVGTKLKVRVIPV